MRLLTIGIFPIALASVLSVSIQTSLIREADKVSQQYSDPSPVYEKIASQNDVQIFSGTSRF